MILDCQPAARIVMVYLVPVPAFVLGLLDFSSDDDADDAALFFCLFFMISGFRFSRGLEPKLLKDAAWIGPDQQICL